MSAQPRQAGAAVAAERIVSIRKTPGGGGQQYEVQWQGQAETTWEAVSRMRRQIPELVRAFEQLQQQQQAEQQQAQQQQLEQQQLEQQQPELNSRAAKELLRKEGATDEGASMIDVVVAPAALGQGQNSGNDGPSNAALLQQMLAMQQIMREQQQQIQQLRASPPHSPRPSAQPSPQLSPQQEPRHLTATAAAAVAPAAATVRRKEPRLSDLAEYNGAGGDKLDAWLAELRRCARYYQLSGSDAVEFAAARLRDTADIWWSTELSAAEQAAIAGVDTLAAAMRARFQPVTTARVAREKLHALQQGGRHVDEYIAEFSKLRAQVTDMAEPDARAQFVRGLRRELAVKLEDIDWESMPLAALIAKAARIGGRCAAAQPAAGRSVAVNQMDIDESAATPSLDDRIAKAVLNAMQSLQSGGMGAKTQTQRGYDNERAGGSRGGARGGHGGRGGRFGGRGGGSSGSSNGISIPGVPSDVVEQRRAAGQCFRCGDSQHQSRHCPNATSASSVMGN